MTIEWLKRLADLAAGVPAGVRDRLDTGSITNMVSEKEISMQNPVIEQMSKNIDEHCRIFLEMQKQMRALRAASEMGRPIPEALLAPPAPPGE